MNLLAPALYVTNRVRFPIKFVILGIIVLIPLLLLGTRVMPSLNTSIPGIKHEQVGQQYLLDVTPILRLTMIQRALTHGMPSEETNAVAIAARNAEKLDDAYATLSAQDAKFSTQLETTDRVQKLR
ncbi:hypothetical protein [Pseudomonas syringae]|uniref:hypothetical protein n=1 Tax=Pseudomonas syringae TaxID=317 RepID=UPI000AE06920